ncbi:MAG: hypothetical protein ACKOPP_02995, partial [Bacteroidota bacterium]
PSTVHRHQFPRTFSGIAASSHEPAPDTKGIDEDVQNVISVYNGLGLQDLVWQYQHQLLEQAMDLLASLPFGSSQAALFLREYAQYLANRQE